MPTKLRKPQPETAVKAPAPARGSADEMYQATNRLSPTAGRRLEMPAELRGRLERQTGYDMGNVEMRESAQPASIGAKAYARGNVIDFAPGVFQPGSAAGEAVIGHEVSHVIQQAHGEVAADTPFSPVNSDPGLERAADAGVSRGASGGAPAPIPSMSYSAAPVQGLFDGIRRRFRAAKQAYNFGKARKAVDEFQGSELTAARGEIAAAQKGIGADQTDKMRMAELQARDKRSYAASDRWGELEADSRDAVGGDMDVRDMNGFWARLGRGTLFHRKEKEARLAQQAEDFRSTAILDREGTQELGTLQAKRSRAVGSLTSAKLLRTQQTQQAGDFFGDDLMKRDGGRDAIGLYQHGRMYEEQNQRAGEVAMGHVGQNGLTIEQVGSVMVGPYLDYMNFDESQYDPNNFDDCVRGYPAVAHISQLSMTIGDELKRHGRLAVFAAMGLGDAQQLDDAFKAKCAKMGPMWGQMKRTLEAYQ